jgi:DNA-directed RNA polymerase specialized sigma24 family protein
MASPGSVSRWISELKNGDPAAAQPLWERYYRRLLHLARRILRSGRRRAADEEDVVQDAFQSFFRAVAEGRFPQLDDRESLWRLLVAITANKALRQLTYEHRLKRGGGTPAGPLNFGPGETSKSFTIPIINDTLVEGDETVHLALTNATGGAVLGSQATATLTIHDDDTGGQSATVTYQQGVNGYTGTTDGSISTQYSDYNGGNGVTDFTSSQIGVYQTTGSDSYTTEALVRFSSLGLPANATVTGATLTVVVDTWDSGASLRGYYVLPAWSATTGSGDTALGWVHRGTGQNWAVPGARGQGTDVVAGKSFVLSGITASGAQTVTIKLDPAVVQSWVNNPSADQGILLVNESSAIVRVDASESAKAALRPRLSIRYSVGTPAPQPGTLQFSNASYAVNENGGTATITVTRTGGTDGAVSVHYATSNGTATAGSDYTAASGTLNFGAGETSKTFTIPIINDNLVEGDETVNLALTSPAGGASLGSQATATLTIHSDDVATLQSISVAPVNLSLGNGQTAQFSATGLYSDGTTQVLTALVNWTSSNKGVATITANGLATALGVGSTTIAAVIGSVAGSTSLTVTGTVHPGTIQLSSSSFSANEDQGAATITVTRSGGSDGTVSVHYATSNGTATAGSDYMTTSGTLTFDPGETSKTFTIPIIDDTTVEPNETVKLTLSDPTGGAALGTPAAGTLTIVDNDTSAGSFTNVTESSGIAAIIAQKYQEDPNWWLSGEHLVDLDNDGHLDLFLDAHNGTSVVALNNGHGVFTRVTAGSWPSTEIHEMFDINGDGKVDLNATYQDGGSQWWINNSTPGHVNFTPTNVTRDTNTSRSQVLFDFNGDGNVDWFRSAPPGLVVDFGDGHGGFAAGSLTFPIAGTDSNDNASFLPGDFDGDGKTDLLVLVGGNYDGTPGKTMLWHNNGNMTFTDVTASAGIPANGTIAKGVGDFNQDGSIDFIAVENKAMPPVIYLNDGHGHFTKKANAISGVTAQSLDYTSWGTAVTTDFDNDGIPDIIMDGKYYLKVLRGTGGGNFTYMNTSWGITDTAASSVDDGLTFGDIDGDGRMDIIGYDETFPTRTLSVYHNDLAPQNNWLNLRLVGLPGNVGAAGAKISVYAPGTNQLLGFEQAAQYDFQVATSYYGYGETERHFGLGALTSVDVVVAFASGKVVRLKNVASNETVRILESQAS